MTICIIYYIIYNIDNNIYNNKYYDKQGVKQFTVVYNKTLLSLAPDWEQRG
jgi:hypothetical protein